MKSAKKWKALQNENSARPCLHIVVADIVYNSNIHCTQGQPGNFEQWYMLQCSTLNHWRHVVIFVSWPGHLKWNLCIRMFGNSHRIRLIITDFSTMVSVSSSCLLFHWPFLLLCQVESWWDRGPAETLCSAELHQGWLSHTDAGVWILCLAHRTACENFLRRVWYGKLSTYVGRHRDRFSWKRLVVVECSVPWSCTVHETFSIGYRMEGKKSFAGMIRSWSFTHVLAIETSICVSLILICFS